MRGGALASAVRDHDPGAPPVPTAVESEHRRDDLAIERQPAVGAAEPAGRTAAPRRPLPEPARRPGLSIFVPRGGVKERTSQQRRAKIRQGPRVRQTQGAQQGALRGPAAQRGAGFAVNTAPPDRPRVPVRHGHTGTGPTPARTGGAGRGKQPRPGRLGPNRVTPVLCRVPRGLSDAPDPSKRCPGLHPPDGQVRGLRPALPAVGNRIHDMVRGGASEPRWRSHSIYLFGVDMYGNTLFTGNPYNWGMGISPSELTTIAVRDDVAVAEVFGETFLYYTSVNPSNGMPQRKVSFVKRVVTFGVPILIGAGYYLD